MLDEFKDGLNHFLERLKSPFGGLFIFFWIITHWEFIYYLIFVTSDVTVEERIINLKFFFQGSILHRLFLDIIKPALLTFTALATYYSFSIIAGVITGYFKRHWEPRVAKMLDTGETVMKAELTLEFEKRIKIEKELIASEQNRTNEFKRYSESENQLNQTINSLERQLINLEDNKSEIEHKLQIALGKHEGIFQLMYNERIKELKLLDFKEKRSNNFRQIMKDKKFNYYYDKKSLGFMKETFIIEDPNIYSVDGIHKYKIENILHDERKHQIYFEKRSLNDVLIYINILTLENSHSQIFHGFEVNLATQNRYKIIYANNQLTDFRNFSPDH